jgi:hypothetical protein
VGNISSIQNGFVLEIVQNGTLPKGSCAVVKFEEFIINEIILLRQVK